jgi:hypothetical protein
MSFNPLCGPAGCTALAESGQTIGVRSRLGLSALRSFFTHVAFCLSVHRRNITYNVTTLFVYCLCSLLFFR